MAISKLEKSNLALLTNGMVSASIVDCHGSYGKSYCIVPSSIWRRVNPLCKVHPSYASGSSTIKGAIDQLLKGASGKFTNIGANFIDKKCEENWTKTIVNEVHDYVVGSHIVKN